MRRVLISLALSFTVLAIASCGGGGGGSAGGGATPVAYASYTTAVTGATPDAAVGDTSVIMLTGAPPASSRIVHPLDTFFAADLTAGGGSVTLPVGATLDFNLLSATQLNVATAQDTFHAVSGAKTGTNTYSTVDWFAVHTAPPTNGAFTATVTAVTTGAVSVGDAFRMLIIPPGFVSIESDELSATGLIKNGTAWVAQASSWNGTGVKTHKLSFSADLSSGTYVKKQGGTTTLQFAFSMSALALPAAITGAKTPATANPGNVPGYTTTAYALATHPANTALTIALNPAAGTVTLAGSQFQLVSLNTVGTGSSITAKRNFTDATLTTADKRASEDIYLEFTATGVLVDGFSILSLWQDPTPGNDGGSGANDIILGIISLMP